MNLLNKFNIKLLNGISYIKLNYIKLKLKNKLIIGNNPQLKNTSRINVWGKEGKICIADDFSIGYNSELYAWDSEINIGTRTSINDNCKIYESVTIGSNCLLASNIFISSGTHNFSFNPYLPIKAQDKLSSINRPIVIEDDCWIGFGVVVMPGVYIGKGAIVGSNAVVTKDIFPYTINGGIPSREMGKRLDFNISFEKINSNCTEHWPFFYKGCNYGQFDNLIALNEGIEIVDTTAVFLLSKKDTNKLKITGFCDKEADLKVSVNKNKNIQKQTNKGLFELKLNLLNQDFNYPKIFDNISKDLKDKFNIVVIETYPNTGNLSSENYKWKITSIGYYED